jgi:hypothetical protein
MTTPEKLSKREEKRKKQSLEKLEGWAEHSYCTRKAAG